MRTVTPDQVTRWYLSLNSDTPTERAHAYQLLNAIFATAADPRARIVTTIPCQITGAGQVTRAHEVRTTSLDELVAIVDALPARLRLAVLLGAWCALRYGEIAEPRRADIDLGKGLIRVRRGVSWPDGKATVGTPKTKAGMRDVHIPPHVLPNVKEHLQEFTGSGPEALLFPALSGAHASPHLWQGLRQGTCRSRTARPPLPRPAPHGGCTRGSNRRNTRGAHGSARPLHTWRCDALPTCSRGPGSCDRRQKW